MRRGRGSKAPRCRRRSRSPCRRRRRTGSPRARTRAGRRPGSEFSRCCCWSLSSQVASMNGSGSVDATDATRYVQGMSKVCRDVCAKRGPMAVIRSLPVSAAGRPDEVPRLRIGELARRAGIPPSTLRAWERRYGVPNPLAGNPATASTASPTSAVCKLMLGLISEGLAPAEAARRATASPEPPRGTTRASRSSDRRGLAGDAARPAAAPTGRRTPSGRSTAR